MTEKNTLLSGIRVLDLSRLLPGPFCSLYLAQMGAEVIKIEEPSGGDYARSLAPELFEQVNRGKKSITLDLRQTSDVQHLKDLVKNADVLLESFRPGVMKKLGCDYDTLKQINPKLVYASLTGYGQTGPYADLAGHDVNYLATAGVLDQMGNKNSAPAMSNVQLADLAGGALTCGMGILAAVVGAQKTGVGTFVDAAMLDGSFAMQAVSAATLAQQGKTQPRGEDMLTGALPNYQIYKCKGGDYIALGALEPKFFKRFLVATKQAAPVAVQTILSRIERLSVQPNKKPKVGNNTSVPVFSKRQLAAAHLAMVALFRLRTRDEWADALQDADACVSAVLNLEEALQHPQIKARKLAQTVEGKTVFALPLQFSQALAPVSKSPALGEHNEEILGALDA